MFDSYARVIDYQFFNLKKVNHFFGRKLECQQYEITPMVYDYFYLYADENNSAAMNVISLVTTLDLLLICLKPAAFAQNDFHVIKKRAEDLQKIIAVTLNSVPDHPKNEREKQIATLLLQCICYCLKSIALAVHILKNDEQIEQGKVLEFWDSSELKNLCQEMNIREDV